MPSQTSIMTMTMTEPVLAESQIKITVGDKGSTYFVHPGAFAPYPSSALHAQIHGSWRNTFKETLDWTDFDEQTIECVLQFLYTGDYNTRRSAQAPNVHQQAKFTINSKKASLARSTPKTTPSPNEAIDAPLAALKNGLKAKLEAAKTDQSETAKAPESTVAEITAHAKIYSFAHRYLFSELEEHSLHRLSEVLISIQNKNVDFHPHIEDAIDIIYAETPSFSNNPARKLMTQFVAMGYSSLECEDLDMLIEEGGEFAADLSRALARSLHSENPLQDKVDAMEKKMRDMEAKMSSLREEVNGWEKWDSRMPINERRWPASYY